MERAESRKRWKRGERQGKRQKAWGASMSLHFPWTHVRDPLLPSVWWSVAGAMSSQPVESLHGSQHKSPECSKLRVFATFPPLPHVSKQLSTLCPPCLHGITVSDVSLTSETRTVELAMCTSVESSHSWVIVPLGLIPGAWHLQQLRFSHICLNMKHCVLFTLKDGWKSNVSPGGCFMPSKWIAM